MATHCFFTGLIAACLENRRVLEWNNEVRAVEFREGGSAQEYLAVATRAGNEEGWVITIR